MRVLPAALILGLLGLPALAQSPSRDWRPEDRMVIGDFGVITSIAAGSERVYLTSPTALLIWRPQFGRWEGPFEPPESGLLARVFAGLVDPIDQSLWLVRPEGWIHYQADIGLWDQGAVPEGVLGLAFDQDDPVAGLFLRTRAGWQLLPRGAFSPLPGRAPNRPIAPASIEEAIRANPTLQANAAAILTDRGLRQVRYTAAARAFDGRGWYLGTSGMGALFLSDAAALPERLPFGLPSGRVASVLSWPGGVWAGTDRTVRDEAAVTFVAGDLTTFRTLPDFSAVGTPFSEVRRLAGQGTVLWIATDAGIARIETSDGRVRMIDEGRGLPDSRVYAISARRGRITAGTAHGLARVDDSLQVERIAPSFVDAAYAVFPVGDSVWVGTSSGVLLALPSDSGVVRPRGLTSPAAQAPVVRLVPFGDTLVALLRDNMLWMDPRSRTWTIGPNLSALLGRLRGLAADGPGFWVAGDRGVGFVRLGAGPLRPLSEGDLPGRVNDLAVDEDYLWVATDGGLVRFRLDAIRP